MQWNEVGSLKPLPVRGAIDVFGPWAVEVRCWVGDGAARAEKRRVFRIALVPRIVAGMLASSYAAHCQRGKGPNRMRSPAGGR
jgi:hypothetical protein